MLAVRSSAHIITSLYLVCNVTGQKILCSRVRLVFTYITFFRKSSPAKWGAFCIRLRLVFRYLGDCTKNNVLLLKKLKGMSLKIILTIKRGYCFVL